MYSFHFFSTGFIYFHIDLRNKVDEELIKLIKHRVTVFDYHSCTVSQSLL